WAGRVNSIEQGTVRDFAAVEFRNSAALADEFKAPLFVTDCRRVTVSTVLAKRGRPADGAEVRVAVRYLGRRLDISLVSTKQRVGLRWWLVCPNCGSRRAALYSPRRLDVPDLACRWCWRLYYPSQA